jgi:mRNA-degrading endonuclease RelE of RelBE toxin-antitoxin system
MRLELTERFQRDIRGLDKDQRAALFETILGLPSAVGDAHRHAGVGLRKIHPSGIWEGRVGLGLRLDFVVAENTCILLRVGTHDEIRRFLRSL